MASHYHTEFSQKKVTAGKPPGARKGVAAERSMPMRTAKWSAPGPAGSGFSRMKKGTPVLKAYVTKRGIC